MASNILPMAHLLKKCTWSNGPVPAASGDQEPVASNDPAPTKKEATELLSTEAEAETEAKLLEAPSNEPTATDTAKEATTDKLVLAPAEEKTPALPPKSIAVINADKEDATEVTDAPSFSTGTDGDASLLAKGSDDSWDDDKPEDFGIGTEAEKEYRASTKETLDSIYNLAEDTNKMTHKTNATVEKSAKDIEQVKGTQEESAKDIKEVKEVQRQLLKAQQVANKEAKIQNMDKKEQRKTVERCDSLESEVARLRKEKQHLMAKISKQRSKKQALVESNKGNQMEGTVPASKKHVDLHSSPSKKSGAAKNLKNTQAAGRLKTKGKGF